MSAKTLIKRWLRSLGITTFIRRRLRALGVIKLPQFEVRLARVFNAPPLTQELLAAIRLISPQFLLTPSEESRAFWEADQNLASWSEYTALTSLLHSMPRPHKVLELGPGLGRSIVFFSKMFDWQSNEIHAYEGEGPCTKYTLLGPRFEDSFCGNIGMLRHVLHYNGITNVTIFNAHDTRLAQLPGPYDFIYSFYSVGFHWSLEHFLDDLLPLMHEKSVGVFTIPTEFKPFPKLAALSHRIISVKAVWPQHASLTLLVIGKPGGLSGC